MFPPTSMAIAEKLAEVATDREPKAVSCHAPKPDALAVPSLFSFGARVWPRVRIQSMAS